jgi:hypothetical protein
MSSEIIQSVTYDNYGNFQCHIFTKFHFITLRLLNDEIDLRVRYLTRGPSSGVMGGVAFNSCS